MDTSEQQLQTNASVGIRFMGVQMPPGIGRRHFGAYMFVTMIAASYAGLLASLEPSLLQLINIPVDEQGFVTGMLRTLQEVAYILLLGVYGVLSDRFGRGPVYIFGFVVTAVGYMLYPYSSDITDLILYRIIIGIGGAAMVGMMITTIADYTVNRTRGWANGIQALMGTLGAFIPPILATLPARFVGDGTSEIEALQISYLLAGGLGIIGAVVAALGLAPGIGKQVVHNQARFLDQLKEGFAAVKDPGIALSYGASFISRGDLVISAAFMSLWLVQYGTQTLGMEPSEASAKLMFPRLAMILLGSMVGGILMGLICDRIGRIASIKLVSIVAAVVFLLIGVTSDPSTNGVMALLFIMGMVEMSAFVASQALVGERGEERYRGAIFGVFGIAGAFGIFIAGMAGGWLYSNVAPGAPFLLFGFFNIIVLVWAVYMTPRIRAYDASLLDTG